MLKGFDLLCSALFWCRKRVRKTIQPRSISSLSILSLVSERVLKSFFLIPTRSLKVVEFNVLLDLLDGVGASSLRRNWRRAIKKPLECRWVDPLFGSPIKMTETWTMMTPVMKSVASVYRGLRGDEVRNFGLRFRCAAITALQALRNPCFI
ncbi:hypothetical protein U1Q18_003090 [Sarracenia purpurea var. burkii]